MSGGRESLLAGPRLAHFRRLAPLVLGGKVAVMIVAEVFMVGGALVISLSGGGSPSSIIKATMVYLSQLLVALCAADLVAGLRASGELELTMTLAEPGRALLARLLPILVVAAAQIVAVGLVLLPILSWWEVVLGWLFAPLPVLLAAAVSLYWNLRLRGAGTVLAATLLSLVPVVVWVERAQLFSEGENTVAMTHLDIAISFASSQLGLALAVICVVALARRRLADTEALLDE